MKYTDKELLRSAQIAYYDINEDVIADINTWINEEIKISGNENKHASYTLSELFEHSPAFKNSIYRSIAASLGDEDFKIENYLDSTAVLETLKEDRAKYVAIEEVYNIIEELQNNEEGSIGSWKLVSYVFNDDIGVAGMAGKYENGTWSNKQFSTSGDGLCAYVFETSNDSAIVAFRGSQPLNGAGDVFSLDFVSDWLSADGGLAVEADTPQQKSVYEFIRDYVNHLGYDRYAFAGHSLGGNLAMHAA